MNSIQKNTNLLPLKPKYSFRHLKQSIQEFHRKYVLVPAAKAANNVVVVRRLHYINTLKQELGGTKAYKLQNSADLKSVDFYHCCHTATKFAGRSGNKHSNFSEFDVKFCEIKTELQATFLTLLA